MPVPAERAQEGHSAGLESLQSLWKVVTGDTAGSSAVCIAVAFSRRRSRAQEGRNVGTKTFSPKRIYEGCLAPLAPS